MAKEIEAFHANSAIERVREGCGSPAALRASRDFQGFVGFLRGLRQGVVHPVWLALLGGEGRRQPGGVGNVLGRGRVGGQEGGMLPPIYDTHCHLDYPAFREDLEAVLGRAREAGVRRMICVGTDFGSSREAIRLAETHPDVWATVGWHPGHAEEAPEDVRSELRVLAGHPRVVAIGETGLDFFRLPKGKTEEAEARREAIRNRQRVLFRQHLEVAVEAGLNCVIHQRACFEDAIQELRPYSDRVRGVFHCFANPLADLEKVLELGSLVSFTGLVTFGNAVEVRESLAAVPEGRYMVETDSPYLAPVPHRGQRCEPAYVRYTAEEVAVVRGCSPEAVSRVTCETAEGFFVRRGKAG